MRIDRVTVGEVIWTLDNPIQRTVLWVATHGRKTIVTSVGWRYKRPLYEEKIRETYREIFTRYELVFALSERTQIAVVKEIVSCSESVLLPGTQSPGTETVTTVHISRRSRGTIKQILTSLHQSGITSSETTESNY